MIWLLLLIAYCVIGYEYTLRVALLVMDPERDWRFFLVVTIWPLMMLLGYLDNVFPMDDDKD